MIKLVKETNKYWMFKVGTLNNACMFLENNVHLTNLKVKVLSYKDSQYEFTQLGERKAMFTEPLSELVVYKEEY